MLEIVDWENFSVNSSFACFKNSCVKHAIP